MKFSDAVIAMTIIPLLLCLGGMSIKSAFSLNERCIKEKQNYESIYFVAESFKRTCDGTGFSSLEEWQTSCRSLMNLDYIAWCNAEDFMQVSYENSGCPLFYAAWKNSNELCEIYYRLK
ncbi:MAG: hypothetical protein MJ188_07310 [Treponema sp.]|nr:hypothetical protein [Treponema sp.]